MHLLNAAFFLQEILDQIADIDLVVNFKCTEDHLVRNNLGAGNFSPCREYLSMRNAGCNLNLQFQNKQLKTSSADTGGPWKKKFHIYSEQVPPSILLNRNFCNQFHNFKLAPSVISISCLERKWKMLMASNWIVFLFSTQCKPLEDYYRNRRNFLIFMWQAHQEKPGKGCWLHCTSSI